VWQILVLSPIPPRWLLDAVPNDRYRLVRAVSLVALPPPHRNACERDGAAPRVNLIPPPATHDLPLRCEAPVNPLWSSTCSVNPYNNALPDISPGLANIGKTLVERRGYYKGVTNESGAIHS
jgi:hypothetical protein